MRVKPSLSIVAMSLLVAMLLLVLTSPAKTYAKSLRYGTQQIVSSSSSAIMPPKVQLDNGQQSSQDRLSPAVLLLNKGKKARGDTCIGPVCGLGLFFASIGLSFVACYIVVYVADKRYDRVQYSRRRRGHYYQNNRKRRPSQEHFHLRRSCSSALPSPSPSAMRRRAAQ